MGDYFQRLFATGLVVVMGFIILTYASPLYAQNNQKPSLETIIPNIEYFNESTSNDQAESIAEKLFQQYLKTNNLSKFFKYSDIYAKTIPIGSRGSNDIFIVSQVMEPPQGCYAKGCMTFIYHSENGKSWKSVFSGHIRALWYDQNSNTDKPANLIASSEPNNSNPGVFMWNNGKYFLVNKRPQ